MNVQNQLDDIINLSIHASRMYRLTVNLTQSKYT